MVTITHKALTGKPCIIDEDFHSLLTQMCDLAVVYGLKLYINSSFREDANVKGAIVTPAQMSNHMVGHAIDCNIIDSNGKFWNSEMLISPSPKIMDFILKCKGLGLRWGGDFSKKDTVHFDDGLNIRNPELWKSKYNNIHK